MRRDLREPRKKPKLKKEEKICSHERKGQLESERGPRTHTWLSVAKAVVNQKMGGPVTLKPPAEPLQWLQAPQSPWLRMVTA